MDDAEHAPPRLRRAPVERAARALLPSCAGVWTAAEIMHAVSVAPLDVGLGAAASAALAGVTGHRATATGLLVAGGWSALAARFGPLAGPGLYCPLTGAWAVLTFCGWRWARGHPSVVAARDKRNAQADWLDRRDRWGLRGSHLLDFKETRLGCWFLVDVRHTGKRASQIAAAGREYAERIADDPDLMLPASRVLVRRHRIGPRIEISIRTADPWAKPIPHPLFAAEPLLDEHGKEIDLSRPYSIAQAAAVGQDPETGKLLTLLLCVPTGGRNVNVVATLDSGKTTLASCISERVTKAPDALLFRINLSLKGDEERDLWGPACHLTAFGPHEVARARKLLAILARIIEYRAGHRPPGRRNWIPSPEDPHLVLITDEIDALTEDQVCKRYLEHLNSKGRQYGYTSVRLGQRGTAEWTGGGNVRAVDGVFCLGRVNRDMEVMHAAGEIGLQLPNMAEYGEGKRGVWAIADLDERGHAAGRGFDLGEPDDISRIVAERADYQPDLQPELKAFLGKTYEELLGTDVYARWARGRAVTAHPRPDAEPQPFPGGLDPQNPLHALAVLVRDGAVQADDETAGALAKALDIHEAEEASVAAWDKELNAAVPDDLRRRWLEQGERLAETRRVLNETTGMDVPDIPHDDLVAHAAAQWQALGEVTEIPEGARATLLNLLTAGTTIGEVATALEVSKWTARTYLERLRTEGRVRMEGEKRTARWLLNEPEDGDGS